MSNKLWWLGAMLVSLWVVSAVSSPLAWWVHPALAIASVLFVVRLLMLDPEFSRA